MAAPHFDPTSSTIADRKAALRRQMRRLRGPGPNGAGDALADHVLRSGLVPTGAVVAGFWPMAGEIDLRPLLDALHDRNHRLCLPEMPPPGQALRFRAWQPGDALVQEARGTWRPTGEVVTPDLLIVPLLAFDHRGRRLGHGGGYYDRTLAALPDRLALGCAYAAQQVDEVPTGPHDQRLDAVATERGLTTFGE